MTNSWGIPLSLRGIALTPPGIIQQRALRMILVESIAEKRSINDAQIKEGFDLSDREMEVLQLVCDGNTNQEISKRLFISIYTVKDHLKHIMAKVGVKSRNQIVSAIKNH